MLKSNDRVGKRLIFWGVCWEAGEGDILSVCGGGGYNHDEAPALLPATLPNIPSRRCQANKHNEVNGRVGYGRAGQQFLIPMNIAWFQHSAPGSSGGGASHHRI